MITMSAPAEYPIVHVTERGVSPKRNAIPCVLGDHLLISYRALERFCWARLSDRDIDLLCVVGAAAFADRVSRRIPSAGWARALRLIVPVREPCLWEAPATRNALQDALQYLTGDSWSFEFVYRRTSDEAALQLFLRQPPPSHSVVLPYSGGLDSLAEFLRIRSAEPGVTPLLLTTEHGANRQTVAATLERFRPHVQLGIPVRLSPGEHAEDTYRTRTLLFFTLAALAAKLAGAERVHVGEAGQGSLGPSLVPYGGEHPYRATHPAFTMRLRRLLLALWGRAPAFEHPNVWNTKAELIASARPAGLDSAWTNSVSCSRNIARIKPGSKVRHCGICGGCLFRRLSLRAANMPLADSEPYVWQDFAATSLDGAVLPSHRHICRTTSTDEDIATYALLSLKHLADFANTADPEILGVAGAELAIPVQESPHTTTERLRRLLAAHEREWRAFVEAIPVGGWAHRLAEET